MAGRLPGTPRTPGSGRKRGSLDKAARSLLTEQMAGDILKVYKALGGVKWLIGWAKANETEFIRQGLARLMPAFPKEAGDDAAHYTQINIGNLSEREVATRIAYALSLGLQDQQEQVIEAREPYSLITPDEPTPQEACRPPAVDPERAEFFREASMTTEEKLNAETLDERCSRVASAPTRPAWMDEPKPAGRPFVGRPRQKGDLL